MKHLLCVVLLSSLSLVVHGQDTDHLTDLAFYGDVMTNASLPEHRLRAGEEFHGLFKSYLDHTRPNLPSLDQLPWITAVMPADSTFSLVTWQVEGDQEFRYYGFFIPLMNAENEILELQDTRPLNSEYSEYLVDQWYGAIYYGIQSFTTAQGTDAYIILGFNAHSGQLNQRVADVLVPDAQSVTLGLPVFWADTLGNELKNRVILDYADAAAATMRFDRENAMLIYDHVIPVNTPEGTIFVPDGSYHGYKYHKGLWELVNKVFTLKMDEPPGGRPADSVKRDLFGRPQKNR